MSTVYKTIEGEVFSSNTYIEFADGRRYAINTNHFPNITAHNLAEIATLGDAFSFIVRFHPDYDHSDEAAYLDDLDCLIDGECDEEKTERITSHFGSDPHRWEIERESIFLGLLEESIKAYKLQCE